MEVWEKIRSIRQAEQLNQREFAEETSIPLESVKNYETGRRKDIVASQIQKITTHPRFMKYTLWLMSDTTAPEAGQISPEIEETRKDGTA